MSHAWQNFALISRGLAAGLLFLPVAFMAMMLIGSLVAGSNGDDIFTSPLSFAWVLSSFAAIGYVFYGRREWLRWVALAISLGGVAYAFA